MWPRCRSFTRRVGCVIADFEISASQKSPARRTALSHVFAVKNADPSHEKLYYKTDNLNSITKMAILVLLQFQWMKKLINLWSFWNSKEEVRDKVSIGHPAYNEYKEWLESVRVRKLQVSCRTRPRPKWSEVDNSANCSILINIHIIYCNAQSTRMVTFPSTVAVIYEIVYTRILGEFIS